MREGIKRIRRTQGGAGKTTESLISSNLRWCETIRYCGMDTFEEYCRDLVLFVPSSDV